MLNFQIFPPCEELKNIVSSYFIAQVTDMNDLPFLTEMYPLNIPALNFLSNPGIYKYANPDCTLSDPPLINIVGQMSVANLTKFLKPGIVELNAHFYDPEY